MLFGARGSVKHLLQELCSARTSNGSQIVHQILLRHADTRVGDVEAVSLLVRLKERELVNSHLNPILLVSGNYKAYPNANRQFIGCLQRVGIGEGHETNLVQGV